MNLPEDRNQNAPIDTAQAWTFAEASTIADSSKIERLSPIALAYIGDAVFELYVRTRFLMPPKRMADYHSQVVTQVRAESQAIHLATLLPYLSESEKEILRRGRNATLAKPRRMSRHIYKQASGLETLIGYLHLSDPQRLLQLLARLNLDSIEK